MFHSSGTSPLNSLAFDSQWEGTADAVRRPMDAKSYLASTTEELISGNVNIVITTTQQYLCTQNVSRQIFKPIRIYSTDFVYCVIKCSESLSTNNAHLAMRVRAVSAFDGRELGGVFASSMGSLTEMPTTAATRLIGNATSTIACSAVTINEPWRMVFELGAHAQAPTAAGFASFTLGCPFTSDYAFTSALTTSLNPWWAFSRDLGALPAGMQHLRGFVIG